jgi:circadian clock protein KaiB
MTETNGGDDEAMEFNLRLYVAGQTPKSLAAIANLKKICEENLAGRYKLEVMISS